MKKEDKQEKLVKNILIIFGVVVIVLLVFLFFKQSQSKIEYEGMNFQKIYFGEILLYTTKIPAFDSSGKIASYIEFDFRNNPRTLKDIEVGADKIRFLNSKKVYLSFESTNKTYEDGGIAAYGLTLFLSKLRLDVKGAMNDIAYKNDTNLPYVNCQTNPDNTVIMIFEGNETKIQQTGNNCYEISFKGDDILKATERFQLAILEQLRTSQD